jgi:3-oxoacyl-[acyl-carrier protein] reductase
MAETVARISMDLQLAGKKALILGGSRGLGRGIAQALANEGVKTAILSRNAENVGKAAADMDALGLAVDIADRAALLKAAEFVDRELGGIDILVNNSGGPPPSTALGVSQDIWSTHFESMVLNLIALSDLLIPRMRARQWGRVLTITSSGVVQPIPTIGVSNTLRASLVAWSKTVAGEVARDGVTANVLVPGRIDTDRVKSLDESAAKKESISLEEARRRSTADIPVGRYGTPEEFGAVAAFLASPRAAYITGSVIRIDGGLIRSI